MQRARLGHHCGWSGLQRPARGAAPLACPQTGPAGENRRCAGRARRARVRVLTPRAHCSARLMKNAPPDAGSCPGHVAVCKKSSRVFLGKNNFPNSRKLYRPNFEDWRVGPGWQSAWVQSAWLATSNCHTEMLSKPHQIVTLKCRGRSFKMARSKTRTAATLLAAFLLTAAPGTAGKAQIFLALLFPA